MKILELTQWLSPGGAERFIVDLSNELSKNKDVEVIVCSYVDDSIGNNNFYRQFLSPHVNYVNLKGKKTIIGKIISIWNVLKLIYTVKPDIVHCHLSAFNYVIVPRMLFPRISFYNTLHSIADKNIKRGVDKCLKSFFYKHGITPITISPICYQSFTDYMGFNTSLLIENGCRDIKKTDQYSLVEKEIQQLKNTDNTVVFINVARVHPLKNHSLLLQAFNKIVEDGYDAILLIIGDNHVDEELMKSLNDINTTGKAYFLGIKSNVSDYLFCSDAFCLTSKWEGAPISLLEAAFAGCYPITTPVGGCKDAIKNENWGALSKDCTTDSYYSELKKYLDKRPHDKSMIINNYQDRYSMKICAYKYLKLFKDGRVQDF